jgi:RNA polymerase sigma-70 factor (ECF subfamily)
MVTTLNDPSLSNEQLAERIARRGDSEQAMQAAHLACEQLFQRHARLLLAFLAARLKRHDLEDVHQAVWVRVWQKLPEQFHGGDFKAWLYQIARNYLRDLARKKKMDNLGEEQPEVPDQRHEAPDEVFAAQERMEALHRCLERLDAEAAALVRARLAGDSYEEICPRLGLKPERAHKLFHQAKAQLQACVERANR